MTSLSSAPTGRNMTAQGNALGKHGRIIFLVGAPTGRNHRNLWMLSIPPRWGLTIGLSIASSQGVALGWNISPRWG